MVSEAIPFEKGFRTVPSGLIPGHGFSSVRYKMFLAGDIGGTHCRFDIFDEKGERVERLLYKSADWERFEALLLELKPNQMGPIKAACFGLPGPVRNGFCKVTNLPWEIDAKRISQELGIPKVRLLNDVEANAYGLLTLKGNELVTLKEGEAQPHETKVILAPGTGLGEAGLIHVNEQPVAIASEGGHADFGPFDEDEYRVLQYVRQTYRRVGYEQILSGPGLVRIFHALREYGPRPVAEVVEAMAEQDPAAVISEAGLNGRCALCRKVLDVFIGVLASEAANLALKFMAVGGVYLGGGIPPRLLDRLRTPLFMERFVNKDKMRWMLESVPIYLVRNDKAALQGAGLVARRM